MATGKVQTVYRKVKVNSGTKVGIALTLVTEVNYLKVGDVVQYRSQYSPSHFDLTVATVPNATTITATVPAGQVFDGISEAELIIKYYSAGQTGRQPAFSFPAYDNIGIVQFVANGTGGASFTLSGSNDGEAWIDLASFTLDPIDGATKFISISVPWGYLSLNIDSIGTDTTVKVLRMG